MRQALGESRAAALNYRTNIFRRSLTYHWAITDHIGIHVAQLGQAVEAGHLCRLPPSLLHDGAEACAEANWARHVAPPGAGRQAPRMPAQATLAWELEEFRARLFGCEPQAEAPVSAAQVPDSEADGIGLSVELQGDTSLYNDEEGDYHPVENTGGNHLDGFELGQEVEQNDDPEETEKDSNKQQSDSETDDSEIEEMEKKCDKQQGALICWEETKWRVPQDVLRAMGAHNQQNDSEIDSENDNIHESKFNLEGENEHLQLSWDDRATATTGSLVLMPDGGLTRVVD